MKSLLYGFLFLFSINLCSAETLKVAVGLALPPYVLSNSDTGIELDIVRESLAQKGHSIELIYLPFARVPKYLQDGLVDAAVTVTEASGLTNVHFSEEHITYQNIVVSLDQKNITINNVADLAGKSIMAFQDATVYLGDDYAAMAEKNSKYNEIAEQATQIKMLYSKRVDSVVMDINIFKYFRAEETKMDTSAKVRFHEIFPPTRYKVGFRDKAMRDQFNEGLETVVSSGLYDEILSRYIQ